MIVGASFCEGLGATFSAVSYVKLCDCGRFFLCRVVELLTILGIFSSADWGYFRRTDRHTDAQTDTLLIFVTLESLRKPKMKDV